MTYGIINLNIYLVVFWLNCLNHQASPKSQGSVQAHRIPASLKGDVIIGLLFSLHHQPKQKRASNTISCGEIREMYGIQRTEATFFTIDKINADPNILPNLTLGVEVRDSCWYAPVALQHSIEFIRDTVGLTEGSDTCYEKPEPQTSKKKRTPLIGVIGPGSSSVALQVQNLLQLFELPQIGYSTTSKDLSDKSRFNYFMRVVPSDYYQAQVMVDIVRSHNWTYVSAVNTDENYGQSGIQAFRELAEKANVCIGKEDSVLSNAEDEVFDGVLLNLDRDPNARVVVCFCEGMTVRGLLAASRRLNLTGRFLFLGSDGWADRSDVTDGFEFEARGSISIRIHSPYVTAFDDYYLKLDPFDNARNPWFKEFWETKFNCIMPFVGDPPQNGTEGQVSRRICTGKEKLSEKYKQEPKLSFVIKAIYTMAYGLHDMVQDVCGRGVTGLCPDLFPFNGSLFKNYLLNVSFTYGDGETVEFDRKGDPPGRYNIMNFQLLPNGSYDYIHVGDWNNGSLVMWDDLQYAHNRPGEKVESVCSKPCAPGYYRNFHTGGQEQKCCWACVPCDQNEILVDPVTCKACRPGFWPNANKTACDEIPAEFTQWGDTEAIIAIAFSCLGFISTSFAGAVFIKFNNTPVVKSSTRELSYLILAGMTLSHATTFPILAKPSHVSCTLARILPGLSFAMIYASLLTKTNRIARILAGSKKRFPTRKPRFMSATAQVLITTALIGIEAGVSSAMLIIEPASPTLRYPSLGRVVLVCNTTPLGVLAPLAFDFFLIALCTLYALKTRNVPENFNEAKFIGFAMYTTCVIWIAFVPIYFGSDSKVITMCMCVTLSAMVTLVFLFFPKLYIILLRPERNNRALFTTSKSIRCHIGSRVASAALSNKPSSNSYSSAQDSSPKTRDRTYPMMTIDKYLSKSGPENRNRARRLDLDSPYDGRFAHEKVEKRTLSCQTDLDLVKILLKLHSHLLSENKDANVHVVPKREENEAPPPEAMQVPKVESVENSESGRSYELPEWATLSASALLQNMNLRNRRFERPAKEKSCRRNLSKQAQIVEESVTDDSDNEHSGKFKQITISLGDLEPDRVSNLSHPGTDSTDSPVSWSSRSENVM